MARHARELDFRRIRLFSGALLGLAAACGSGSPVVAGDNSVEAGGGSTAGTPPDATVPGTPPPDTTPAVPGTPVHFLGRIDTRDATGPRCAWTYCGLSTRVRGDALDVVIGGTAGIRFQVLVDGVPTATFQSSATQSTFRVAQGLAAGDHDVSVVRASEAAWGASELLGFVPPSGTELVSYADATDRRLELVGDSITAGYGNEGCPFSPATQNGYLSYGAVAARAVGADVHVIAWSGIGMYRNANGVTTNMMPARYPLTLPADASSVWDASSWTPDAVVINLGTNDFAQGNPGQPFIDAYVAFVRGLLARYPGALVLCADNGNGSIAAALDTVIATVGDASVKRLDFAVPDWSGCDGHPSVSADQAMGSQLAARLQSELGW